MTPRPGDDNAASGPGEWVELGRISGVFGIRGWVKVYSFTRPREGILSYRRWFVGAPGDRRPVEVCEGRSHRGGVIARLSGCDDRDAAEALVNSEIAVRREALAANAQDEYYWRDLIGLKVFNLAGIDLGDVREIMETGANDVLVVSGDRERLVPFAGEVVRKVDPETGRIIVDWEEDY